MRQVACGKCQLVAYGLVGEAKGGPSSLNMFNMVMDRGGACDYCARSPTRLRLWWEIFVCDAVTTGDASEVSERHASMRRRSAVWRERGEGDGYGGLLIQDK